MGANTAYALQRALGAFGRGLTRFGELQMVKRQRDEELALENRRFDQELTNRYMAADQFDRELRFRKELADQDRAEKARETNIRYDTASRDQAVRDELNTRVLNVREKVLKQTASRSGAAGSKFDLTGDFMNYLNDPTKVSGPKKALYEKLYGEYMKDPMALFGKGAAGAGPKTQNYPFKQAEMEWDEIVDTPEGKRYGSFSSYYAAQNAKFRQEQNRFNGEGYTDDYNKVATGQNGDGGVESTYDPVREAELLTKWKLNGLDPDEVDELMNMYR